MTDSRTLLSWVRRALTLAPFVSMGPALAMPGMQAPAAAPSASTPAAPAAPAALPPPATVTPFGWPFGDEALGTPRGATTRGAPVTLAPAPSTAWMALQQPGLSRFEKDRRAILAMAGGYRASFDFIEVAGFTPGFRPDRPYRSWGTEKVYVVEDNGTSIVLQHLLVMSIVDKQGQVQGPFVTKHWRQDWQYEPSQQLVFQGDNTWSRVDVPQAERAGRWRQTVYQVDDSPRYSGVAAWQHLANYSSWADADAWRPLPRREYSVRQDYQALIGHNRHTITPDGWLHEQQNLKAMVDTGKGAVTSIVGREYGLNRYERLADDFDWRAGDRYLQATSGVWSAVRRHWDRLFAERGTLRLKGSPDRDAMFVPLFEYADAVATNPQPPAQVEAEVRKRVDAYLRD